MSRQINLTCTVAQRAKVLEVAKLSDLDGAIGRHATWGLAGDDERMTTRVDIRVNCWGFNDDAPEIVAAYSCEKGHIITIVAIWDKIDRAFSFHS